MGETAKAEMAGCFGRSEFEVSQPSIARYLPYVNDNFYSIRMVKSLNSGFEDGTDRQTKGISRKRPRRSTAAT
jgi:hypothetical protein